MSDRKPNWAVVRRSRDKPYETRSSMLKISRICTVIVAVIAGLALIAGAASANRSLSLSPAGTVRSTSEGKVTFEEPSGSFGLACNLTLTGTTERIAPKRAGTHVGSITEGRTNECRDTFFGTAGEAVLLFERGPFEIVYSSFLGTLPAINGILFRADARFLLTTSIGRCLYETTAAREAAFLFEATPATGVVTRGHFLSTPVRRLIRLSGFCPETGNLAGKFTVTPTQTVRLL